MSGLCGGWESGRDGSRDGIVNMNGWIDERELNQKQTGVPMTSAFHSTAVEVKVVTLSRRSFDKV